MNAIVRLPEQVASSAVTLAERSVGDIADLIGDLDTETKAIEAQIKAAKAELAARGIEKAEGVRYSVTKVEAVRWNLDLAAAKEALGEAWCTAHSKIAAVVSYRIAINREAVRATASRRTPHIALVASAGARS